MQYNTNVKLISTSETRNVKGLAAMNYSKEVSNFAEHLAFHYAKHDGDVYTLFVSDIAEFDLHEFAAIIMASDDGYANEATGCDNPWYEKAMLPALLRYLKNSTDKDEQIEFNKAWREGVTKYFETTMQELIDDACNNRLHSEMNDAGYHGHIDRNHGDFVWSRYA